MQSPLPNTADAKAAFRKPSSDAAHRKYRRRSPSGGSSSSEGSPKQEHGSSSNSSKEDPLKAPEYRSRKDDEADRDLGRSRHGRSGDNYRHSDWQSSRNSHGHARREDYFRHDKYADEERNCERLSSRSGREPRGATHYEHARQESDHCRSKDYRHAIDRYSRDRRDSSGYRSKEKDREASSQEHHKYKDTSSYEKLGAGRRHGQSDELDWGTRERDSRDDRRDSRRSFGDYKSDQGVSYEGSKGHHNEPSSRRDGDKYNLKEACKSDQKELEDQKHRGEEKKNYDESEISRDKNCLARASGEMFGCENKQFPAKKSKFDVGGDYNLVKDDGRQTSISKQAEGGKAELGSAQACGSEAGNDVNAAKFAAMKAAELVNRNLVGVGYMTTDQKKKLLWGNKKTTTTEESGNRWDSTLFPDRERQEKFNKLMGVKGDLKIGQKSDNQNSNDLLHAEKQKELQLDLEKQYTAGLRRRDGRTVGLGL